MPQNRSQPNLFALITALSAALALSACLSDSPNQVGGEYLDRNGLKLETPLYRVDLEDFPVDSFWTGDVEQNHLGDSVLLLGADSSGFSAQTRLAFDIADTTFLDSLKAADGDSSLRLSVGFPLFPIAPEQLKATLKGVPSMRFLVESWVFADTGLSGNDRLRLLRDNNRRFLFRQDTSFLMPGKPVLDTMVLELDSVAYGKDSLQTGHLHQLRDTLLTDESAKWTVYMQLTFLPDSGSQQALLRLGGRIAGVFPPALLFGKTLNAGTASTKTQKLFPLATDNTLGVNYKLRFDGPSTSMLYGKTRGIHLRINRKSLLDSVAVALVKQGVALKRDVTGEFDLSYFVPFARLSMPLDTPSFIDGNFPLEILADTDLDSLIPLPDPAAVGRVLVPLGDTVEVVRLSERTNPSRTLDTLSAAYQITPGDTAPSATALRRLIIISARDTTVRDTSYLLPGQKKDIAWAVPGYPSDLLILSATAGDSVAAIDVHFNIKTAREPQVFRDPVTGQPLNALQDRIPSFLTTTDSSLNLRTTFGIQRIFNRVKMDTDISSDLFIQPSVQAAVDTVAKARVQYPVMAEIRPSLVAGKLAVDITLYLFPLKDR